MPIPTSIEELVGEEISGIGFIRDYLEIYFDGPVLKFLEHPEIIENETQLKFPNKSARKILYTLIGLKIFDIKIDDKSVVITTSGGHVIRVVLRNRSIRSPESLQFVPYNFKDVQSF